MTKIFKYLLLCLFVFTLTSNYAQQTANNQNQQVVWYSLEQAMQLVKIKPKKIFMDVYTDWCGWCKRMDAATFTNPVIAKYLNENYYAVKLNAERKDTVIFHGTPFVNLYAKMPRGAHQIASFYLNGSLSYPSIVFLDENLNSIVLIQSYMEPAGLEPILSYLAAPQTVSWEEYQKKFVGQCKPLTPPAPANAPSDKSK
ncbi:MAG: DUF255 domain-containing protein [Bacteroidota bacterium]|nr:DUF255 domain-containing protein [Bacteroidota bacterium]